jgi:hypothetical protein
MSAPDQIDELRDSTLEAVHDAIQAMPSPVRQMASIWFVEAALLEIARARGHKDAAAVAYGLGDALATARGRQ